MFDWSEIERYGHTFQHRLRAVIAARGGEADVEMAARAMGRLLREKPGKAQEWAGEALVAVFGEGGA